jgi:hypothetical protein
MSIPSAADQLQDTYSVSSYMKERFPHVLRMEPNVEIQHPHGWSLEFALEVDLALHILARAFGNQGIVPWLLTRMHLIDFNQFQPTGM